MNKMSKYIIDVGEGYIRHGLERTLTIPVRINEHEDHWMDTRIPVTPYTEPDAIRNGAYEKGIQDIKQHWVDAPRTCAYQLGYENGLNDAWEAARKICLPEPDGGINTDEICNIFNVSYYSAALKVCSASEAIEKIWQYEQEKDRQAKIEYDFDEIKDVLNTTMKECNVSLDDIAEVLQKMKEAE